MENNFIQMSASAGHAVDYTIGLIFKYITDCVQLYFTKGFKIAMKSFSKNLSFGVDFKL